MAISKITSAQFETSLQNAILSRNPEMDVTTGPIRDIITAPVSQVLEDQNDRIRRLSLIMSLLNTGEFTDQEMDEIAFNEQILRRPGIRSSTTVFFQARRAPSVDLTVPVNFPAGTQVDPTTGRQITFRTTETRTLPAATAALFFNASSGFYELEVNVSAITTGDAGNVGPGRINQLLRPLTGFDQVTNRAAASNGKDTETNEELAERIIVAILGTDISTKFGVERETLDEFSDVLDIITVFGLDPLLTRASTDAGAVDAYIIGTSNVTAVESQTFLGVGQTVVLDNQPVTAIASVDAGGPAFIQGTDYSLIRDTGPNANSVRAVDGIVFLIGGTAPTVGATINITYTYNSLLQTLQDNFIVPDRFVFGRDLLFKQGTQINTEIAANLSVLAGTNATTILAQVVSVIVAFINSLGLGDDVEISDVQAEVRKIPGVDNFVPTTFRKIGGAPGAADIAISRSEFARIASGNVTLTLV